MSATAPLVILLGLGCAVLAGARLARNAKRHREGFDGSTHDDTIKFGQERYNPLTSLLDLGKNPFVGPSPGPQDIINSRDDIRGAMAGLDVKFPSNSQGASVNIRGGKKTPYNIPGDTSGLRAYSVQKCEKVNTIDCSAFDNPDFAGNCGMCFKPGSDSQAQGHIGGLFLDPQDKTAAELQAQALGEKSVNYSPSVGTCPPGFFMINQAQCQALVKRLDCESKKTYDLPNCSQCYTDGSFTIVDAAVPLADLTLLISYIGNLTVTAAGKTIATGSSTQNGDNNIDIGSVPEGTPIIITVDGGNSGVIPSIGGFIQGPTATGVFQLQIAQLADADLQSGIQPRVSGEVTVGGQTVIQMKPARGYTKMALRVNIPVTFVDPTDDTAGRCASGPYLTQEGSAKILKSGTCFQPGNGPGSFSLDCLQEKFNELGCTSAGTGYPGDTTSAASLNKDASGNPRQLGDVADLIYENAIRASTGVSTSGQKLNLSDWNQASMFCTGVQISTPCDAVEVTGQMTQDCMADLYANRGSGTRTGGTYSSTNKQASLTGSKNRFCTTNGLLSPFGPDGSPQQDAINRAFASGGTIQNVKDLYDQTHRRANDNTLADSDRSSAIEDCYGVSLTMPSTNAKVVATGSAAAALKAQYDAIMSDINYLQGYGLGPGSGNATFDDRWAKKQALDAQIQVPIKARYVRIKPSMKPAPDDRCLQISQLQVFNSAGQEVARGKPVTASSILQSASIKAQYDGVMADLNYLQGLGLGPGSGNATFDDRWARKKDLDNQMANLPVPEKAVDGNPTARPFPQMFHDGCDSQGKNQFWMVDLGSDQDLSYIVYYNRSASDCCTNRADGMPVELLDSQMNLVGATQITGSGQQIQVNFTIFDTQNLPWNNLA